MISMGCGHAVASVESLVKRLVEEILANPYNNNWEARKNNAGSPDIGHIDLKWSKFLADIACEGQGLEEAELYERALRLGWSWWEISEKLSLLLDHGILAKAGSLIERRSL